MVESIETIVIGAGQAGLSAGYFLKQQGLEHTLLDKAARPGDSWRSQRWDSFTFVSPNWTFQLPGGEYDGLEPDGFMTRAQLVERFDAYVEKHRIPITYNTRVTSVQEVENGNYLVRTQEKDFLARNVVVGTGWFQVGKMPPFAAKIPASIFQLHSGSYRNPQSLPPGAVLVVGSGQSGAQIAEELNESGRKVFLATGGAPHLPRRYRGKDAFHWLIESGFVDQTFEQMQFGGKDFVAPMLSGKNGGHGLNLHKFYRDGVILLGHATDFADGKLILAPDLKANLGRADMAQKIILKRIDDYIQRAGIEAPVEDMPVMMDGYQAPEITSLDLQGEGIHTIIWACGYSFDSSIFAFPMLDRFGLPEAPAGVSDTHPGLYFVGFPFLPTLKSGFLAGLTQGTTRVIEKIKSRRSRSEPALL